MKKTRVLLSSIVTMLLCICMIAGATFALFTSEVKTNIAVTSGKVEIVATPTLTGGWSAKANADGSYGKEDLVATNNSVAFTSGGGNAVLTDDTLTITNIMPGDGVTLKIAITNNSTVTVKYSIMLSSEDTDSLLDVLNATYTVNGSEVEFGKWTELSVGTNPEVEASIGLPVEVSDTKYMDKTCNLTLTVIATQLNAAGDYAPKTGIDKLVGEKENGESITEVTTNGVTFASNGTYQDGAWVISDDDITITAPADKVTSFSIEYTGGDIYMENGAAKVRTLTFSNPEKIESGKTYELDTTTLALEAEGEVKITNVTATSAPKHEHSYTEWGHNNEQHWKYCQEDNVADSGSYENHTLGNYTDNNDGYHTRTCECGYVEKTLHDFGDNEATCKDCGAENTGYNPPVEKETAHSWDLTNVEWNLDANEATFKCLNDNCELDSNKKTVTATFEKSAEESQAATCEAAGKEVYNATATIEDGKVATGKVEKTLNKLDHSYTGEYVKGEKQHAQKCVNGCDLPGEYVSCTYTNYKDDTTGTHTGTCVCGNTDTSAHNDFGGYADNDDGNTHTVTCGTCGNENKTATHELIYTDNHDNSTHKVECKYCNYVIESEDHDFGEEDVEDKCTKCEADKPATTPDIWDTVTTDFPTTSFSELKALVPDNNNKTETKYYAIGKVTRFNESSANYCNFYIEDKDGTELYIYGLFSEDGSTKFDLAAGKAAFNVGDLIVVYGQFMNYNSTFEFTDAWLVQVNNNAKTDAAKILLGEISVSSSVTENFELPTADGKIEWTVQSGDGIEIDEDGKTAKVTRTSADQDVVLLATAKVGTAVATKTFNVTVKAEGETNKEIILTASLFTNITKASSYVTSDGEQIDSVMYAYTLAKDSNGNIQTNKSSYLYNTTAIPGYITSIDLEFSQAPSAKVKLTCYFGDDYKTIESSNNKFDWTGDASTMSITCTPTTSTAPTFFKLSRSGDNAAYISRIVIHYIANA